MAIKASGGAAGCTGCRQRAGSRSLPRRHWDDLTAEIADGHRKCIVVTHAKETINQKGRKRTYSATTCVEAASAEADIQIAQVAGHALHSAPLPRPEPQSSYGMCQVSCWRKGPLAGRPRSSRVSAELTQKKSRRTFFRYHFKFFRFITRRR